MYKKALLGLTIFSCCGLAYAWPDPYSYVNYLQDLKTAINTTNALSKQATQIQNQIEMIKWQKQNSKAITDYQWQNIQGVIQKIDEQSKQGQALSYSAQNLDAQFRQKYPNYSDSSQGQANYQQAYQQWNASTLDTLRSSLDATQVNASHFQSEHEALMQLKNQGASATGRLQALQVVSEISAENVNQLQELKRIMMAQSSAQNAYMAEQVSQKSYEEKNLQMITDHIDTTFPKYKDNSQFGQIQEVQNDQ
jgi:P-type conjugative transfer protein TrbJ